MQYGTSYFPSLQDALNYYNGYGDDADAVQNKIDNGEIHIGDLPPEMLVAQPGEYKRHAVLRDENRFESNSEEAKRWYIGVDIRIG